MSAVAVVTGAGRGLGHEVARQLAQHGMTVVLAARNPQQGEDAAAALRADGLDVEFERLDLDDPASISAAAAAIGTRHGRVDVLVNNAAGPANWTERASDADLDAAHAVVESNLFGTWRVLQAFVPLVRASEHPRIVNVTSGGGSHDDPAFPLSSNHGAAASYGISKAALNALTAKLAAEVADERMLVNAVCPGITATSPDASESARPVAASAVGIVWAATLPDDGPSGRFFRDGREIAW